MFAWGTIVGLLTAIAAIALGGIAIYRGAKGLGITGLALGVPGVLIAGSGLALALFAPSLLYFFGAPTDVVGDAYGFVWLGR